MTDLTELTQLSEQLRPIAVAEGGDTFMGWPDRWWEAHTRRCTNGHVSTRVLKSEALGRDACLASGCGAPVHLTFPEDRDGPIVAPTPENVECPTCRGTRLVQPNRWTDQMIPCPDCNWKGTGSSATTPENVDSPEPMEPCRRCQGEGYVCECDPHGLRVGDEGLTGACGVCPRCNGDLVEPENVEEPTSSMHLAPQPEDFIYDPSTPENVEEPT